MSRFIRLFKEFADLNIFVFLDLSNILRHLYHPGDEHIISRSFVDKSLKKEIIENGSISAYPLYFKQ